MLARADQRGRSEACGEDGDADAKVGLFLEREGWRPYNSSRHPENKSSFEKKLLFSSLGMRVAVAVCLTSGEVNTDGNV